MKIKNSFQKSDKIEDPNLKTRPNELKKTHLHFSDEQSKKPNRNVHETQRTIKKQTEKRTTHYMRNDSLC